MKSFLLAEECLFCRKPVGISGSVLCPDCFSRLRDITGEKRRAGGCLLLAVYEYTEELRPVMHSFKYRGDRSVGIFLAGAICDMIQAGDEAAFDIAVGVPKHKKSGRRFCQAEYLAKKTASYLGIRFSDKILYKKRNIKSQTLCIGKNERVNNVKGAYAMLKGADVRGKRVLLIDDLTTSGATMTECAEALSGAGAEVVCAAAAKPLSPEKEKLPIAPGEGYYEFSDSLNKSVNIEKGSENHENL